MNRDFLKGMGLLLGLSGFFFYLFIELDLGERPVHLSYGHQNRLPNSSKKAAVKKLLKQKGYKLKSGNSVKGISAAQTQDILSRGELVKLKGVDCYKWKIGRTSPRIILAKDKKTVLWAGSDHDEYEKAIRFFKKNKP